MKSKKIIGNNRLEENCPKTHCVHFSFLEQHIEVKRYCHPPNEAITFDDVSAEVKLQDMLDLLIVQE